MQFRAIWSAILVAAAPLIKIGMVIKALDFLLGVSVITQNT